MTTFTVLGEHLALLRAAEWVWCDDYAGAPAVDAKRPFGFSYGRYEEMAGILGWEKGDDGLTRDQEDELARLWRETLTVLSIALDTGACRPGEYERTDAGWRLVETEPIEASR